jgi:Domain of unknown function (DUF6484)
METDLARLKKKTNRKRKMLGVVRGVLCSFSEQGYPFIDFYLNQSGAPVLALSLVRLKANDEGLDVILMFEDGDLSRPIIMGLVQPALTRSQINNERLDLTANERITLQCGKASITLTREGKVLIKGEYVSSNSSGINCIKGGSVRIN